MSIERYDHKKYNSLFKKRFKEKTNLSTTKPDDEFFTDLIKKLKKNIEMR